MKRALPYSLPLALLCFLAWAGPRPRATMNVPGRVTPVTLDTTSGYQNAAHVPPALLLQCPGGMVWYRTLNADELAAGGLVTAGAGMTDGGAFGVFADFTVNSDPIQVVMQSDQVAFALLGTDAGTVSYTLSDGGSQIDAGILPCFVSVP